MKALTDLKMGKVPTHSQIWKQVKWQHTHKSENM